MKFLMSVDKTYEIDKEELADFIRITEESGYKFFITLSGGEPLIWSHLREGVKMLKNSSICTGIEIYTNAVNISALDDETVERVDELRVSEYLYNRKNIEVLMKKYPDKTRIVPRTKFWINPTRPVEDSLPAICLYDKVWYYDRRIFACAHSASLIHVTRENDVVLSNPLEFNYLEGIDEIKLGQSKAVCTVCISNKRVRDQVEKVNNVRMEML